MRGITIRLNGESVHTGNGLGLVQEVKEIGKPTVQSYTVEVPGRNGLLNLTKGLTGRVTYSNRLLKFEYFGDGTRSELLEIDELLSRFHGETVQIVDDDYPNAYYEGEMTVSTAFFPNYARFILEVDAQPFRYKSAENSVSRSVGSSTTISIDHSGAPVVPTITVTAETKITFKNTTVSVGAGTYRFENFMLEPGTNTFTVSGSGTVTIKYREGAI